MFPTAPVPHVRRLILACLCSGCCVAQTPSAPALIRAIESRSAAEWRPLLEGRADVQARDGRGNTALHLAALNHDLAAVEALLAAGAEADPANTAQATPLLYGAGHPRIVRALLARGANVNAIELEPKVVLPLKSGSINDEGPHLRC